MFDGSRNDPPRHQPHDPHLSTAIILGAIIVAAPPLGFILLAVFLLAGWYGLSKKRKP